MAGALLLLAFFASVRVWYLKQTGLTVQLLGWAVPQAAFWAGGLFVVAGAVIFVVATGAKTGIGAIDSRVQKLIDLLIQTEAELAKVSWPGPEELTRSTAAVLTMIVILGGFLVLVNWLVASLMGNLGVLPK